MEVRPLAIRLQAVSDLIEAKFGLHYPSDRFREMERQLLRAAQAAHQPSLEAYLNSLLSSPLADEQCELLARTLTIGETYFFRDPGLFEAIAAEFVPGVLASRPEPGGRLRVWSAGCCTGEEAYTLAIVFDRLRRTLPLSEPDLLATDINQGFLRHARAGVYRSWSFRGAPVWLQQEYFARGEGECFVLRPDIRRAVRFAPLNLAEFNYPAESNQTRGMDLILCRHVLMYFSPEQFARAVRHLARCLVEGGWLVLSAAEVSHVAEPELERRRIGAMTVFVRRSRGQQPPKAAVQRAWPWEWEAVVPPPEQPEPAGKLAAVHAAADGQVMRRDPAVGAAGSPVVTGVCEVDDSLAAAREQASQGDLAAALAACDRLVARDKLSPATHYLRATILQEQGALAEAERAWKRVLYLEPDFIAAHVSLANLARNDGRLAEAKRHWRNALTLAERAPPEQPVPEAEGMTASQLREMLRNLLGHTHQARVGARAEPRANGHHRRLRARIEV